MSHTAAWRIPGVLLPWTRRGWEPLLFRFNPGVPASEHPHSSARLRNGRLVQCLLLEAGPTASLYTGLSIDGRGSRGNYALIRSQK